MANNSGFVDIFRYFVLFWGYLLLPGTRREANEAFRKSHGSERGYLIFDVILAVFFGAVVPGALIAVVLR